MLVYAFLIRNRNIVLILITSPVFRDFTKSVRFQGEQGRRVKVTLINQKF